MVIGLTAAMLISLGLGFTGMWYDSKRTKDNYFTSENNIRSKLLGNQEFNNYLHDAYALGYIDPATYGEAASAYRKAVNGVELSKGETKTLTNLYNQLYDNDSTFRQNWDNAYKNLSNEDKLKWLDGAMGNGSGLSVTIPGPAYLDTSFDNYQKKVEPVKFYTNKELAKMYNLDFDFDNILADYKKAGEAKVEYAKFVSEVAKNMSERENEKNTVAYLDAIRNNKGQAINKGMTSGAQAAADILATSTAIANKSQSELETGLNRNQIITPSLLENAQAALSATDVYNNLAKNLGNTANLLYENDRARYGADVTANANFFAADENLRATRAAANQIMGAAYNAARAQNNAAYGGVNDPYWVFQNILLPKNNGNVDLAVRDYLMGTYNQNNSGYNALSKQGALYDSIYQNR
jgi:hypothetical protein